MSTTEQRSSAADGRPNAMRTSHAGSGRSAWAPADPAEAQ